VTLLKFEKDISSGGTNYLSYNVSDFFVAPVIRKL